MALKSVRIEKPEANFILGQSHFIKTVKTTRHGAMPGIGLAWRFASRRVRR